MSLTVSHVAFIRGRATINLTAAGRVRIRFGEDLAATLDAPDARALLQDLEGALYRLAMRQELAGETIVDAVGESPLAP